MIRNPRKPFPHWFDLRQDILFHGITIEEAAEKYGINYKSVSRHLNQHPRIKTAYYSRPWAKEGKHRTYKQMRIEFIPAICEKTHEALEDIYLGEGPFIYSPVTLHYKKAMRHLIDCARCQEYETTLKTRYSLPYRFDCPSLREMLRPGGANNVHMTEHFLVCHFCPVEYEGLKILPAHRVTTLIEKEIDFYPSLGWKKSLDVHHVNKIQYIVTHPIFTQYGIPPEYIQRISDPVVKAYLRWRIFRYPIFEIGLSSEQESA